MAIKRSRNRKSSVKVGVLDEVGGLDVYFDDWENIYPRLKSLVFIASRNDRETICDICGLYIKSSQQRSTLSACDFLMGIGQ